MNLKGIQTLLQQARTTSVSIQPSTNLLYNWQTNDLINTVQSDIQQFIAVVEQEG